jgi:ASCH domain-containing protein
MHGLLIRSEPLEAIMRGEKTWEIRGRRTYIRGQIALIRSGSGQIVGTCELVDCIGPLSLSDLRRNCSQHGMPQQDLRSGIPYAKTYAWVLKNARRLEKPFHYRHKLGIITWHPLPDSMFL